MPRLSHDEDLAYGARYRASHRDELRVKGRAYYAKNKERICAYGKRTWRWRAYGICPEDETVLEKQNGLCALCFKPKPLVVDHDHDSGRIRGLLCKHCNSSLASFGDDEDGILRVLNYVRGPHAISLHQRPSESRYQPLGCDPSPELSLPC
jgi:hypothetical protein